MKNGWKFINGTTFNGAYDGYLGQTTNQNALYLGEYINKVQMSLVGKSISSFDRISPFYLLILRFQAKIYCNSYQNRAKVKCAPLKAPCLFDLDVDPCEMNNLAESNPRKLEEITSDLLKYIAETKPTRRKLSDPRSDPANFNGVWSTWQENSIETA